MAAEARELKELKSIYSKAADDIAKKIRISDGKINVLLKDFDNLDDTQKSILQSQIYQRKFQQQLKTQIDGYMSALLAGQYKSIDDYMRNCYTMGFVGALYDISGQGIPLVIPIDEKQVVKALYTNSKISKKLYTKLGEDVAFLKKRIASTLSRGIATADSYANIARNLASDSNVGFNRAMRIARTEGHRIQANSAFDAQLAAKEAGADIVKQWDATLDGRTRKNHRKLDGQIRELEEPFEVGGMKAMYPSGFGRPEEDINCRCALMQRARWGLDEDELETLKERAAFYGLDKTKDFDDFKKKYLKASTNTTGTKSETLTNRRRERMAARKVTQNQTRSIPNFSNMEYADVMKWANTNLQTTFEGLKGANHDFVKETVNALAIFENKMGGTIDGLSVKFGGLPSNVFAKYEDKTKTLLLKRTGSLKSFEDRLKKDNARYRAKWKNDKDYHATDTFSGTVLHELGHAVDIETGQNLSRILGANADLYERSVKVSAYAGTQQGVRVTKASEAWAENFSAYMAGGVNAKKVPDEVREMIEDYFKKPLANAGKSSKINSGAIYGALNDKNDPTGVKRDNHANAYYDSLRNSDKEQIVEAISGNAALSETTVSKMYDHLVVNKYDLEDGHKTFDPDYNIAESIRRLREGKDIQEHDLILVRHEAMEYDLMNSGGLSYKEAHETVNELYNYQEALTKWLDENNR